MTGEKRVIKHNYADCDSITLCSFTYTVYVVHHAKISLRKCANRVAPDQPVHLHSLILELHCLILLRHWLTSGQGSSQIILCGFTGWSGARLDQYIYRSFLAWGFKYRKIWSPWGLNHEEWWSSFSLFVNWLEIGGNSYVHQVLCQSDSSSDYIHSKGLNTL